LGGWNFLEVSLPCKSSARAFDFVGLDQIYGMVHKKSGSALRFAAPLRRIVKSGAVLCTPREFLPHQLIDEEGLARSALGG
jgi:hypothetical protein